MPRSTASESTSLDSSIGPTRRRREAEEEAEEEVRPAKHPRGRQTFMWTPPSSLCRSRIGGRVQGRNTCTLIACLIAYRFFKEWVQSSAALRVSSCSDYTSAGPGFHRWKSLWWHADLWLYRTEHRCWSRTEYARKCSVAHSGRWREDIFRWCWTTISQACLNQFPKMTPRFLCKEFNFVPSLSKRQKSEILKMAWSP